MIVSSPNETVIEPNISCRFGYYKCGSKAETEELFDSEIYKNDSLGLKELHESGRLHFKTAYCTHGNYQEDEQNFIENTLPFLIPAEKPLCNDPSHQELKQEFKAEIQK